VSWLASVRRCRVDGDGDGGDDDEVLPDANAGS